MNSRDTLVALGASLLAAGLLARVGRRIGLPTIPLFMIAGLLFGPNTPGIELVHDAADFELLATLGLVLLLFYLGLEFSVGELTAGGRSLAAAGSLYLALNIGSGIALGFALGWGTREALVVAGAVGISSSAIVTKIVVEMHRLTNPETRLVLGILIAEELQVSDAIGAFMVRLVITETTVAARVRKLVLPLRDTFAALFSSPSGSRSSPATSRRSVARLRSPSS